MYLIINNIIYIIWLFYGCFSVVFRLSGCFSVVGGTTKEQPKNNRHKTFKLLIIRYLISRLSGCRKTVINK